MSIESELQKAKATGVTVSKDKLLSAIRASNQMHYPIMRSNQQDYVVLVFRKNS